ncbi:hypothetical protein JOY44_21595 [Phormidium sp. CLA17]|uniref:hypothetical protein n=1 Tax=Leptolyngbya sp. Cla-17 TaxID=2803751 RepID=UPI0014921016|nr:hypothetical protein [Leptolyngbya sp. Cla-17]MBM0744177.1 hypothetical protein [Leptolyngbya sp. Cla-17]
MVRTLPINPINHRVAIYGRVAIGFKLQGKDNWTLLPQPIQQAQVEIIDAPASFQRRLYLKSLSYGQKWESLSTRLDRASIAVDGSFYFIDLPPGKYTLRATCFQKATILQAAEKVITIVDGEKPSWIDLILITTGIVGQVTSIPKVARSGTTSTPEEESEIVPVAYAQVQLQNSGEQTRCDRDGKFQLLNLEAPENPSTRKLQLQISAPGYDAYTQNVDLLRGAVYSLPDIQLTKKVPAKANGTSA